MKSAASFFRPPPDGWYSYPLKGPQHFAVRASSVMPDLSLCSVVVRCRWAFLLVLGTLVFSRAEARSVA